jgi:PBP1b-binding outer membrane lipoprotein LpoB
MKKLILILITASITLLQGCVTTRENIQPTIPKPPVQFSNIDR